MLWHHPWCQKPHHIVRFFDFDENRSESNNSDTDRCITQFNRSAQSARPGPCVPRCLKGEKEERMKDEGNTPSTNRNQESNTQKFVENRPPKSKKIDPIGYQNRRKQVPKSSQERQEIRIASSGRAGSAQGVDFPAIGP